MLVSRRIVEEPNISIVPAGTDISFGINSQHFVLGYFHRVPPGPLLPAYFFPLCRRA
jgi:hypothetical protein